MIRHKLNPHGGLPSASDLYYRAGRVTSLPGALGLVGIGDYFSYCAYDQGIASTVRERKNENCGLEVWSVHTPYPFLFFNRGVAIHVFVARAS